MAFTTGIAQQRLHNQRLSGSQFTDMPSVVAWSVAVQAQDYGAAKWAVAQRMIGVHEADLDAAFDAGTILRTHVMRPTWHFVAPADLRWLLQLTAPRVHAACAYGYRTNELDDALFARVRDILIRELQGGQQLTRDQISEHLERAGIATAGVARMANILIHEELEGVICSGARQGKQFTYRLLVERVPPAPTLTRDEALAELTRRYFASHGPATAKDFSWWSGLTMTEVNAGIASVKAALISDTSGDQTYWFAPDRAVTADPAPTAYLLPNYDEYIVGYTDRSAIFDPAHHQHLDLRGNVLFQNTIVLDGQIAGTWRRTLKSQTVIIEPTPFAPLTADQQAAFEQAGQRYGDYLGLTVELR